MKIFFSRQHSHNLNSINYKSELIFAYKDLSQNNTLADIIFLCKAVITLNSTNTELAKFFSNIVLTQNNAVFQEINNQRCILPFAVIVFLLEICHFIKKLFLSSHLKSGVQLNCVILVEN